VFKAKKIRIEEDRKLKGIMVKTKVFVKRR
jgi:hypothetical protein